MTESRTLPPVLQGAAIVPSYRIYFIGRDNHISRPAEIVEYTGDFEAIQKRLNLWMGMTWKFGKRSRLVMRFPHNSK